eukprot:Skav210400  [mRNA]  locus=scaffold1416:142259:145853:- [translate_table: standard]
MLPGLSAYHLAGRWRGLAQKSSADINCGSMQIMQDSDDETMLDDGKLPLVWQLNLGEQQVCEPECLQLLHEYSSLLEAGEVQFCLRSFGPILFKHYAETDKMSRDMFTTMLKDGPSFLNIYGNTSQQIAASKYKMLWVLALLEARLPRKFRKNHGEDGDEPEHEASNYLQQVQPQGADSLWHQRDADFDISTCENQDLKLGAMRL